jgi:hypothetical protein
VSGHPSIAAGAAKDAILQWWKDRVSHVARVVRVVYGGERPIRIGVVGSQSTSTNHDDYNLI